jgi:mycothione reductase
MTDFDVLVIGGGTGNNVAAAAADAGLETALVEPGRSAGPVSTADATPRRC